MAEMKDNNEGVQWEQPSDADRELTAFVVQHCDRWRDNRDQNYLEDWLEYERIFRGVWASEDRTRESERSRLISPATQQAVETRHAEIMEAIFGQGEFFDIQDDDDEEDNVVLSPNESIKLHEDFKDLALDTVLDATVDAFYNNE